MQRSVFLSTFLFAAVLSPITLQGFNCAPPSEASLKVLELRLGDFHGENVIEAFDPDVFSYDAIFPEEESAGVLWVRAEHPSMRVDVEYEGVPVRLVGQSVAELDVPLGLSELTIDVSTRGAAPDSKRYVVRIQRAPVLACTEQGIREAIARGGGPIFFDCDGPTRVLTEAEIIIDKDVILDGEGNLIVDAGGGSGGSGGAGGAVLPASVAHRVFSIPEGVTADLIGFTVTGGSTTEAGGGILNAGTLTLANSVVSGNTARFGGGIRNEGEGHADVIETTVSDNLATQAGAGISNRLAGAIMTLTHSTVQGNTATGNVGGIGNSGTLTVNDTTVSDNEAGGEAGGIRNAGGTLTASNSTVSGNTAQGNGGGVLNRSGATLTMTGSTISNNSAANDGGGILNEGTLSLANVTLSANAADLGGGVNNLETGTLTMSNSTVSENTAASFGGGIRSFGWAEVIDTTVSNNTAMQAAGGVSNRPGATMTLTGCSVQGNTGVVERGGIANGGRMTVQSTTVSDNQTGNVGGGIGNRLGGTLTLLNSTVSGNVASFGGGISNQDTAILTLTNTTISGNSASTDGGGVLNDELATATISGCTVFENTTVRFGGGIRNLGVAEVSDTTVANNTSMQSTGGVSNRGTLWLTGVTVAGNFAAERGGGVGNVGAATLTNSTVSGNEAGDFAGGIRNGAFPTVGTLTLVSTTVADNVAPNGATAIRNDGVMSLRNNIIDGDCELVAPWDSLGGNIESPSDTCGLDPAGTDRVNVSELELNLGPLANNGGPTETHALLPGSLAIDFAQECVNAEGFQLLVDQRGASRPAGPACDSGAFELGGVLLPRDQCINEADRAVYESLEYVDESGNLSTCTDAANGIASDCVFGSPLSSPPLVGCPEEAGAVIGCHPSCPPDVIAAFDQCVASCTAGATGLSAECADCYGAWAGCGAQSCVVECAGDVGSPPCLECLGAAGCTAIFDACTGLPGDVDCSGGTFTEYLQDFESLDQSSSTALSDDGWIVFGNVFTPDGTTYLYGYGFPAPNNIGGFCGIASGQGGPEQGDQQLLIISDYNNVDEQIAGNRVEANTYRERPITVDDVGNTVVFSFDARRSNINDPGDPDCINTTSPPCDSTADAFIKTIDPDAGFAITNVVANNTTSIPETWARYSISFTINPGLVGQLLQVGFSATASNFEPSGVLYDNVAVALEAP